MITTLQISTAALSFAAFCILDSNGFASISKSSFGTIARRHEPTSLSPRTTTTTTTTDRIIGVLQNAAAASGDEAGAQADDWNLDDDQMADLFEDYDGFLDGEIDGDFTPLPELDQAEKAWRHVKKPLLSIGGKGASLSHGNSLRQLLNDHTAVKVKVNLQKFGSLKNAFATIKGLAEESGAPKGIELIQFREGDRMILFGLPGTFEKIENGEFPPKPVKKPTTKEEDV
eukprot:CAMPEP_0195308296 /NCGR_PEP_ID=MMETSP0707-20130614/38152_1 /TAXON_ID=33640 /ORGANISM="Asterionellopsis glacialis, Strain CCMP134" /LENGTH=228 /DNA_ID=CAMNT_0040372561 /DNA_START=124 /DNA_END=810 /DNA_ORIENTATION=+